MNEDKVYDLDEIKEMSDDEFQMIIDLPGVVIEGTAVVRDKFGNVKED